LSHLATNKSLRAVEVNTVDAFQGREKDVIVLSVVRPGRGGGRGGGRGDFMSDPRRACVALTRAKRALIVVTNTTILQPGSLWAELVDDAKRRNAFFRVKPCAGT
jgi:senataxin